jgi:hypothetical protein
MKNPSDPIGNRTRNLPACSAEAQPTAPPRAPICIVGDLDFYDPTTITSKLTCFTIRLQRCICSAISRPNCKWKLKEEALDRSQWRSRFGRGYGPVVRQTTE